MHLATAVQTPFNLILRGPDLGRLEGYARNVIRELATKPVFWRACPRSG